MLNHLTKCPICDSKTHKLGMIKSKFHANLLYYANTLIDLPFMGDEKGINEAGTFQLICRDCDSKIFREYENPEAYRDIPSSQMLAQIAMKNYLLMICVYLLIISLSYFELAK